MIINLTEREITAIENALRAKAEGDRESAAAALAEVPALEAAEAEGKRLMVTARGARHIAAMLSEQAAMQDTLRERLLELYYGD